MVDARGQSCPLPVVMTQRALKDKPAKLEVLLDAQVAVENVTRFANSQGYQVSVAASGEEYTLTLTK